MTYGVKEITNLDGDVVIESDFINLREITSGATNVVVGGVNAAYGTASDIVIRIYRVNYSYIANPLIAVRADDRTWAGVITHNTYADIYVIEDETLPSTPVNWKLYTHDALPIANADTGYGVNIYNDTGQVSFSSNTKYGRMVDTVEAYSDNDANGNTQSGNGPNPYGLSSSYNNNYSDRFTSYVIQSPPNIFGSWCAWIYFSSWKRSDNTTIGRAFGIFSGGGSGPVVNNRNGFSLIILE